MNDYPKGKGSPNGRIQVAEVEFEEVYEGVPCTFWVVLYESAHIIL